MHYLTELAGKLVTSYQDRENLSLWVSDFGQGNQDALVRALRAVLEHEVATGRLRYVCPPGENDGQSTPAIGRCQEARV
jgi:hypothetical protein